MDSTCQSNIILWEDAEDPEAMKVPECVSNRTGVGIAYFEHIMPFIQDK